MDMYFRKVSFKQFKEDFYKLNFIDATMTPEQEKQLEDTVRKIYDSIKLPRRKTPGAAGYDFFAPYGFQLEKGDAIMIPTGIRWDVSLAEGEDYPELVCGMVPRSGLGTKYGTELLNTIGIIDCDYCVAKNTGHIILKIKNNGAGERLRGVYPDPAEGLFMTELHDENITNSTLRIAAGDGFAQAIITKFFKVNNEIKPTESRNGGFGSTDEQEQPVQK